MVPCYSGWELDAEFDAIEALLDHLEADGRITLGVPGRNHQSGLPVDDDDQLLPIPIGHAGDVRLGHGDLPRRSIELAAISSIDVGVVLAEGRRIQTDTDAQRDHMFCGLTHQFLRCMLSYSAPIQTTRAMPVLRCMR